MRREEDSYSYLTARYFKKKFPHAELFMIIGSDQWKVLDKWKNLPELASMVKFIVASRYDIPQPRTDVKHRVLHNLIVGISATMIRHSLNEGIIPPFLNKDAGDYIQQHRIYQNSDADPTLRMTLAGLGRFDLLDPSHQKSTVVFRESDLMIQYKIQNTDGKLFQAGIAYPREQFHQALTAWLLKDKKTAENGEPYFCITGGGVGAGKSTILNFLEQEGQGLPKGVLILQADQIKLHIPEYCEGLELGDSRIAGIVHEESVEIISQVFKEAQKRKIHIATESTLYDIDYARELFDGFRKEGYKIRLISVTTDIKEAFRRSFKRAVKTGRMVSLLQMLKGHIEHNKNLAEITALADEVGVYENTGRWPRLLSLEAIQNRKYPFILSRGAKNLETLFNKHNGVLIEAFQKNTEATHEKIVEISLPKITPKKWLKARQTTEKKEAELSKLWRKKKSSFQASPRKNG